jgi:hypothetical protein
LTRQKTSEITIIAKSIHGAITGHSCFAGRLDISFLKATRLVISGGRDELSGEQDPHLIPQDSEGQRKGGQKKKCKGKMHASSGTTIQPQNSETPKAKTGTYVLYLGG